MSVVFIKSSLLGANLIENLWKTWLASKQIHLTLSGPGGGGLRGPDDQTHCSQSETSYPMSPNFVTFSFYL